MRLVDGESEYEGLVEVCLSQRWGTVNGDGWSSVDTQVVCRQLGYPTEGYYGSIYYNIVLLENISILLLLYINIII